MRRIGFSLVEVLVCIAIVCMLAALIFSATRAALQRGKDVVCLSNLKQIHLAMGLYREDYGVYPPNSERWPALVHYLGSTQLSCPASTESDTSPGKVNYFLHAFFYQYEGGTERADQECMEERGPSFPIAHDSNHMKTLAAYQQRASYFIYVRADGSVARVDEKKMDQFFFNPTSFPCPSGDLWVNFP